MQNVVDIPATLQVDANLIQSQRPPSETHKSRLLTPLDFKRSDDEDSDTLERFFKFAASDDSREYELSARGFYNLTRPLIIENIQRGLLVDLEVRDTVGMANVVTIKRCMGAKWQGEFRLRGNRYNDSKLLTAGGETINGVRIEDCRGATLCDFKTNGHSGWGVYHGSGNSNMLKVGDVESVHVGASTLSGRSYNIAAASFSNVESGNIWQRTTIQLSGESQLPSKDHHLTKAYIVTPDNKPHKIVSADHDAQTLTVYPRIPDQYQVAGTVFGMLFGGALCLSVGGYTAKARHGMITATRCGIGYWPTDIYSPTGDGFTGQFNGIDIAMGNDPENAFGGIVLNSVYHEHAQVAEVVINSQVTTSSAANGSVFMSITSLDMSKVVALSPLTQSGKAINKSQYVPISGPYNGEWMTPSTDLDVIEESRQDPSSYEVFSAAKSNQSTYAYVMRPYSHLKLTDNSRMRGLRGTRPIKFDLYGASANGAYKGRFRIYCDHGYTINGTDERMLELPDRNSPVTIHAMLESGNNWIVTFTEHQTL